MAETRSYPPSWQVLQNTRTKDYETLVAAQPLAGHEAWTATLAFRVVGGRTDLFAHAVVPTPADWPMKDQDDLHGVRGRPDGWEPNDEDRADIARHGRIGDWLAAWARSLESTDDRLTTAIVRSALTGDLERVARVQAIEFSDRGMFPYGAVGSESRPRGRRRGDLRFLASVAARYVELSAGPTPIEALAEEMGEKVSTTRNRIYRARERGLLTSAGQGRRGGQLTEQAINLLKGADDGER